MLQGFTRTTGFGTQLGAGTVPHESLVLSAGRRRFWSRQPNLIFLLTLLSTGLLVSCSRASESSTLHWNRRAAARYLDQREARWAAWPGAARDHGTFCISCHTALSYALARPDIESTDNDKAGAAEEARLIADVRERVASWAVLHRQARGISWH